MKNILKIISILFVMFPSFVFAYAIKKVSNLPSYNAVVSNVNGAEYYDKNGYATYVKKELVFIVQKLKLKIMDRDIHYFYI